MKVCCLTTSYPRCPGDFAGVFTFWLHRELVKRGVEVHVIAPGADGLKAEEIWEGVHIHRFRYFFPRSLQRVAYGAGVLANLRKDPWAWIGLPTFLLSFFLTTLRIGRKCDLLHCFWSPTAVIALPLGKLAGKGTVLTVLGSDIRYLPAFLNRLIFALVDRIIAPATEIFEELEKLGVTNYRVIPMPVDESRFHPGQDFSSVRKDFGVRDEWVVTFVARLDEFKDPLTFVRAIPEIRRRIQDVKFFLVGDGPLRGAVEELVARDGLQDMVHLTGLRADVERFLGISHVFVALSPYENTWSSTIAEAMFMEVPCIITDAGYSARFFTHRENCLLISPREPKALADAVVELLADEKLRAHIVNGAKDLLRHRHRTIPEITKATMDLYRDLVPQASLKNGTVYS